MKVTTQREGGFKIEQGRQLAHKEKKKEKEGLKLNDKGDLHK
jgi:hypothetical protein